MDINSLTNNLTVGVIAGVIAALANLIIVRITRPRLKVSKDISKEKDSIYRIKVINKTWCDIEDIKLEAFVLTKYTTTTEGDEDYKLEPVKIKCPHYTYLSGYIGRDKKMHNNCIQVSLDDDLEQKWKGSDVFIFQVTAFNKFTGVRRIKRVRFHCPSKTIKKGKFKSGQKFEIIEE